MSAQEAASTEVPVIASHRVPYVTEYLLGDTPDSFTPPGSSSPILFGDGAVVVQADDVDGFAYALEHLLGNDVRRVNMGRRAYNLTIPYFTWQRATSDFLDQIGVEH